MCCGTAKWKREQVADHKFDFVDVREFHDEGCFTRLRYVWLYILIIKSFLVYVADAYTAIAMLASNQWSGSIIANAGDSSAVKVPFSIGKWIFCGCIIMSFLLLLWEARKARMYIRSRDISYCFTNVMANNYYSMKSYDHFCFFAEISNSKKRLDDLAFFVFFTFKGWKRLIIADAPRQVINALTLFSFLKANNFTTDISKYIDGSWVRAVILCTMIFTVVIWAGSAVLLALAALAYVPLLCHIRGNLKEYCCHKVDKRIGELMKRKARTRQAKEAARLRKEAAGDYSHLRDKKGNYRAQPVQQPTLPNVSLDDEDDDRYYNAGKSDYYPESLAGGHYAKSSEAFSNAGGHFYPPRGYPLQDAPAPYYSTPSDIGGGGGGYEASIISMERPLVAHAGPAGGPAHSSSSLHDHPSSIPLSKAPSYRSEASDRSRPLFDGAPPMPPVPPPQTDRSQTPQQPAGEYDYFGRHHGRQAMQEELYEPIGRRTQLYERAVAAQQPTLDRPPSQASYYGAASERRESEYDMGDYYAADRGHPPYAESGPEWQPGMPTSRQQQPYRSAR